MVSASKVITAEEQETIEAIKGSETNESPEVSSVQMSDNTVLRKLLRGPRYFDPPAVNCKAGKRKKPCFLCGSFEHAAKQCNQARDCFICKKGGHQAKDCPEKSTGGSEIGGLCLKCGQSGHEMFQCKNSYSSDDLKEMQCYVCKEFGHLCCIDSNDGSKWEVSCYKCGQLGHNVLACTRLQKDTACFKCGEEGHFPHECSSAKAKKYRLLLKSLKIRLKFHEEKDYIENGSAPPDIGKAHKRKKIQNDDMVARLLENTRLPEGTTGATTPSSCFKCGEAGHFAGECTSSGKGLLEESTGAATPGSCFKCGEEGHFTHECRSSAKACTRLQEETTGATTRSSCFKCGEAGHFARECTSSGKGLLEETTGAATPSLCFKCGEEGHFARECRSYAKARKKYRQLLKSPRSREEKDYIENGSAPPDIGKAYKRKKIKNDDKVARLLENTRLPEGTTGATTPSSCFKGGEAGHFAGECTSSGKGLLEETTGAATPGSCLKCGEEGHFAHECRSSAKATKMYRLFLKSLRTRDEKDYIENGSAPPDICQADKRKKIQNDDMVVRLLENLL